MKYAFSTLACPGWSWDRAISAAASLGYQGIEWRLVDGALVSSDFPLETCRKIAEAMRSERLQSVALDTSIQLAVPAGEARAKVIAEALGLLERAQALRAGMLRVFIGQYPPGTADATALQWVSQGLEAIVGRARELGVVIALEVHSFEGRGKNVNGTSDSSLCNQAVQNLRGSGIGILWDVGNPFEEGETLEETWDQVKESLLYLHVKDERRLPDGHWECVLNGEGEIPLGRVVRLLRGHGFDGWLSYEWEKKWHPELAEPEVALPHYIKFMRALSEE